MSKENKETAEATAAEPQNVQQPESAEGQTTKPKGESKPGAKSKAEPAGGTNALKSVGLAACKRHNLEQVWVTADGQAFPRESDAKAHALNLPNNKILKVTAK